jgi:hypothetical protein
LDGRGRGRDKPLLHPPVVLHLERHRVLTAQLLDQVELRLDLFHLQELVLDLLALLLAVLDVARQRALLLSVPHHLDLVRPDDIRVDHLQHQEEHL